MDVHEMANRVMMTMMLITSNLGNEVGELGFMIISQNLTF